MIHISEGTGSVPPSAVPLTVVEAVGDGTQQSSELD